MFSDYSLGPRRLLPKDILQHARKFLGEEAERAIKDAVKKHVLYSPNPASTAQWVWSSGIGNTSTPTYYTVSTSYISYANSQNIHPSFYYTTVST